MDKKIDPVFELVERLQSISSNGSISPREEDSFEMNGDDTNGEMNGDTNGTNGTTNGAPVITRTRLYSEVDSGISSVSLKLLVYSLFSFFPTLITF